MAGPYRDGVGGISYYRRQAGSDKNWKREEGSAARNGITDAREQPCRNQSKRE
jgi:hypothetical protein